MNGFVIKEHKSNYPNPVEFNSKDLLEVGAKDMEYAGWIWVVTRDGNQGWAPIEYIELLDKANQGIAKFDYCARELDVTVGEQIKIENTLCGWHYATNSRSQSGWVPQDCVHFA